MRAPKIILIEKKQRVASDATPLQNRRKPIQNSHTSEQQDLAAARRLLEAFASTTPSVRAERFSLTGVASANTVTGVVLDPTMMGKINLLHEKIEALLTEEALSFQKESQQDILLKMLLPQVIQLLKTEGFLPTSADPSFVEGDALSAPIPSALRYEATAPSLFSTPDNTSTPHTSTPLYASTRHTDSLTPMPQAPSTEGTSYAFSLNEDGYLVYLLLMHWLDTQEMIRKKAEETRREQEEEDKRWAKIIQERQAEAKRLLAKLYQRKLDQKAFQEALAERRFLEAMRLRHLYTLALQATEGTLLRATSALPTARTSQEKDHLESIIDSERSNVRRLRTAQSQTEPKLPLAT